MDWHKTREESVHTTLYIYEILHCHTETRVPHREALAPNIQILNISIIWVCWSRYVLLWILILQSQLVMMDVIFSLCIMAFEHELCCLFFRSGCLTHLKKCCHALAPFFSAPPFICWDAKTPCRVSVKTPVILQCHHHCCQCHQSHLILSSHHQNSHSQDHCTGNQCQKF